MNNFRIYVDSLKPTVNILEHTIVGTIWESNQIGTQITTGEITLKRIGTTVYLNVAEIVFNVNAVDGIAQTVLLPSLYNPSTQINNYEIVTKSGGVYGRGIVSIFTTGEISIHMDTPFTGSNSGVSPFIMSWEI